MMKGQDDDNQRYIRQMTLEEIGEEGQRLLSGASALIIGAGGLGSPVIQYLAGMGIGQLTIIDGDSVSVSNLHRQVIHSTAGVGNNKAEAAAEVARRINPTINIRAVPRALDPSATSIAAEARPDVIIDCSDNVPTRYLADQLAVVHRVPLVHGSCVRMAGQVAVFRYPAGAGTGYVDMYPIPTPPSRAVTAADVGVYPPVCGVVGSMMASEAVKVLLRRPTSEVLAGRMLTIDLQEPEMRVVRLRDSPSQAGAVDVLSLKDYPGTPW